MQTFVQKGCDDVTQSVVSAVNKRASLAYQGMVHCVQLTTDAPDSSVWCVISGVPQGSILGPLLFLLYINDLPEAIKSKVFLFADDLKMIANPFDKEVVDDDLRSLEIWENTWLLKFNTAKCKVLHFDINNNPCNDYVLDGSKLEVVDVEQVGKSFSKSLSTIRGIARLLTLSIVCVVSTVAVFNGLDSTRPAKRLGHVICNSDMPRFSTIRVVIWSPRSYTRVGVVRKQEWLPLCL